MSLVSIETIKRAGKTWKVIGHLAGTFKNKTVRFFFFGFFLPLVQPGSYTSGLAVGARGDISCASPLRGEL